jgi:hypothetical protein
MFQDNSKCTSVEGGLTQRRHKAAALFMGTKDWWRSYTASERQGHQAAAMSALKVSPESCFRSLYLDLNFNERGATQWQRTDRLTKEYRDILPLIRGLPPFQTKYTHTTAKIPFMSLSLSVLHLSFPVGPLQVLSIAWVMT